MPDGLDGPVPSVDLTTLLSVAGFDVVESHIARGGRDRPPVPT
ncbi:MAG: hypothetical protein ABW122_12410 [Ilumatobacteraceae bacterium]